MKRWLYELAARCVDVDASWLAVQLVVPLAASLLLFAKYFDTDIKAVCVGYVIGIPACSLLTRLTVRSQKRHIVVTVALCTFFVTFELMIGLFGEVTLAVTPVVTLAVALVVILYAHATNGDDKYQGPS